MGLGDIGMGYQGFPSFYDPADDSLYLGVSTFLVSPGMRMETAILRPQALHSLRSEDRILQTWEDPRRSRSSSIGIVTGYSTQLQVFRRMRMPRLSRLLQNLVTRDSSYWRFLTVSARRLFLAPVGLLAGQSSAPTSSLRSQMFRHFRDSMRRAALHFAFAGSFQDDGIGEDFTQGVLHVDLPTPAPESATPPVVALTELIVSRSYFNFWGTASGEAA